MANTTMAFSCPKCGSSDLAEVNWNKRKCNHCGAESIPSDDRTRLEIIGWQCPKCGFNNQPNSTFCGKCGASLVRICPKCLSVSRQDLTFCGKCGANYEAEHHALSLTLDRGQPSEHVLQYLESVLRLDPADGQALCWRGQAYITTSQWRPAIEAWGRVYRATPQDPLLLRLLTRFTDSHLDLLKRPGLVDARLSDEHSRRYLQLIRSRAPNPPLPLGRTSMALLNRIAPTKAHRIEEMYQAEQAKYVGRQRAFEQAQSELFSDRMTLAHMCVEALEELAERKRLEAERRRLATEQAERRQAQLTAKREAKAKARQPGRQTQPDIVQVQVQPKKKRKACCGLFVMALMLLPISAISLLVWLF